MNFGREKKINHELTVSSNPRSKPEIAKMPIFLKSVQKVTFDTLKRKPT